MFPPLLSHLQFTLVGARPLLPLLTLAEKYIDLAAEVVGNLDTTLPLVTLVLRLTLDHTQPAAPPHLASIVDSS